MNKRNRAAYDLPVSSNVRRGTVLVLMKDEQRHPILLRRDQIRLIRFLAPRLRSGRTGKFAGL
jgi:hypothetical protein